MNPCELPAGSRIRLVGMVAQRGILSPDRSSRKVPTAQGNSESSPCVTICVAPGSHRQGNCSSRPATCCSTGWHHEDFKALSRVSGRSRQHPTGNSVPGESRGSRAAEPLISTGDPRSARLRAGAPKPGLAGGAGGSC